MCEGVSGVGGREGEAAGVPGRGWLDCRDAHLDVPPGSLLKGASEKPKKTYCLTSAVIRQNGCREIKESRD